MDFTKDFNAKTSEINVSTTPGPVLRVKLWRDSPHCLATKRPPSMRLLLSNLVLNRLLLLLCAAGGRRATGVHHSIQRQDLRLREWFVQEQRCLMCSARQYMRPHVAVLATGEFEAHRRLSMHKHE